MLSTCLGLQVFPNIANLLKKMVMTSFSPPEMTILRLVWDCFSTKRQGVDQQTALYIRPTSLYYVN